MMATETRPAPTVLHFECPECGTRASAQSAAWIEHLRSIHRCPTPAEIARALRGEYDG